MTTTTETNETPTIRVERFYDPMFRPQNIYNHDARRPCTDEEIAAAISGALRMVETVRVVNHPSYGRSEMLADGTSRPVPPGHGGGHTHAYTLTPDMVREFVGGVIE